MSRRNVKYLLVSVWDEWITCCSDMEALERLPGPCPSDSAMPRALQETKPFFRGGSIAEVELHFIALQQLVYVKLL